MASHKKNDAVVIGDVNRSCLKFTRASMEETVLTSWDDMIACGMNKFAVENAYKKHFGTKPDIVHLNDDFCKTYGWLSYNLMGNTTYDNVSIVPKIDITGTRHLENDTDTAYEHTVAIEATAANSATVSVTSSSEISMGAKITVGAPELGIGGEFSESFTFKNEHGFQSTQSTAVKISDTVKVTVPPHSKIKVYLEVKWDKRAENFEIPVEIDANGMTGAQFPKRVDGHLFWGGSHYALSFAPPFNSVLRGTMTAAYNTTGNMFVGRAQEYT